MILITIILKYNNNTNEDPNNLVEIDSITSQTLSVPTI